MKSPLRMAGRTLRRFLTRHLAPGPNSLLMAADLGGVMGCSFVYCGSCERPMAGVVYSENEQAADMVSLGCTGCGYRVPVEAGILEGPQSLTVHSSVVNLRSAG
jgi:hypothetical protein